MVVPFSDDLSQHSHVSADGREDTGLEQAAIWSTGSGCYIPSSSSRNEKL